MAASDSDDTRIAFFTRYQEGLAGYAATAALAEQGIRSVLEDEGVFLHDVVSRAKQPISLLQKLRMKDYADPEHDVTDLVGVRVITYFQKDVAIAEEVIRRHFVIDEARSQDKRPSSAREFGYQSVHLIVELSGSSIGPSLSEDHEGQWFEVQIRSILQHSWAEIEHEIVYKAGTEFAEDTVRSFAAAAASLEVIESVFQDMRAAFEREVDRWNAKLRSGDNDSWEVNLDGAGVVAALCVILGRAEESVEARRIIPEALQSALSALQEASICTARDLNGAVAQEETRVALETFAANAGWIVDEIPLDSVVALLVATRPGFPIGVYPDLIEPRHLRAIR